MSSSLEHATPSASENVSEGFDIKQIESDIAQQEQMLKGLDAQVQAGVSPISAERLRVMHEAVEDKKRHLRDLKSRGGRDVATMEEEEQFEMLLPLMEQKAMQYEQELNVLHKYADDPGVRQVYERLRQKMLDLRDRFEDVSKTIPANSPVRKLTNDAEQRIKDMFLRMLQVDVDERQETRPIEQMSAEDYDKEVVKIMEDIVSLEDEFGLFEKQGLTEAHLDKILSQLDGAHERLQELDQQTAEPAHSEERRALIGLINGLREKVLAAKKKDHPLSPLSAAREAHQQVKAAYAEVSHRLDQEQRRDFRVRIARLSALVRHAEDAQWRRLFVAHDRRSAPRAAAGDYFKSQAFVRAAASLALARAGAAAVAIGNSLKLK